MSTSEKIQPNSSEPSIEFLQDVEAIRKDANIPEYPLEKLAQSGSVDKPFAARAYAQLTEIWNKQPERDSQNAKTMDLMGQLEQEFSEQEIVLMLENLTALQLTTGCNGACHFCSHGKKKGVTAKYSFQSLEAFFKKYGKHFDGGRSPLYWDSDPFDYQDGEKSFLDVYKLVKEVTGKGAYISTAIPRGREREFIKFMKYFIAEWGEGNLEGSGVIRLSLGKHNVARIEATMKLLTDELLKEGYTDGYIESFFSRAMHYGARIKDTEIYPVGDLIGTRDDIRDLWSSPCLDGVILAPHSVDAVMVVAPTIYEPSGQKNVQLNNRNTPSELIPKLTQSRMFRAYEYDKILPSIKTSSLSEYHLEDPVDDICLSLGRETAALFGLVNDMSWDWDQLPDYNSLRRKFFKGVRSEYVFGDFYTKSRRSEILEMLEQAKTFSPDEVNPLHVLPNGDVVSGGWVREKAVSQDDYEKIEFYILLTETYLAEVDFLTDLIEENQPEKVVTAVARLFTRVGRGQVDALAKMIETIQIALFLIDKGGMQDPETNKSIKEAISKNIGGPFGYSEMKYEELPEWIRGLVE